ncbi:MAG: ABC transporter ATP-binding protein [Synergistaceae bacterium]|jgi:oligopeptide/dipeptide ABC transporter ATP-binding protein|nr:ABC transporter ATP-binding protein [Synergistaceae bacterium]
MTEQKTDNPLEKETVLEIKDLCQYFPLRGSLYETLIKGVKRNIKAVDHVDLTLYRGETTGLVGESGCGKSTLARTIVRLYEPTGGEVRFLGFGDISKADGSVLAKVRHRMQMIFQDPYSSLNPSMTVRQIFYEILAVHKICPRSEMKSRTEELLNMVGLAEDAIDRYPSEFSGGQRQRIGIARAIAMNPDLLIADEPVSALDMSIQAQIINLLVELREKLKLTMLFISHDLRVVEYISDRVAVMYLGMIVEEAPTDDLFKKSAHPYADILIKTAPAANPKMKNFFSLIEGEIPSPINMPPGCRFHPRCPYVRGICKTELPQIREIDGRRRVACHFPLIS